MITHKWHDSGATLAGKKILRWHGEDVGRVLAAKAAKCNEDDDKTTRSGKSERWWGEGVRSIRTATSILGGKRTWDAGSDHAARAMRQISAKPLPVAKSVRRRRRRGPDGDNLDMGRVWNGDLDNAWTRCEREAGGTAPRALRIVVDVCVSSGTPAEEAMWPGIAASVVADRCIAAGLSVEIVVAAATVGTWHDDNEIGCYSVVVKGSNEPFDLNRVLNWTAMPAAFRGPGFRVWRNRARTKTCSGLGRVLRYADGCGGDDALRNVLEASDTDLGRMSVYVPPVRSLAAATAWIEEELGKLA